MGKLKFFLGMLLGIALTAGGLFAGGYAYCRISGRYLVFGKNSVRPAESAKLIDSATADKLEELTKFMDLYYYEDYDIDAVRNGLYAGTLSGLGDPYSVYYTKEEYADLKIGTSGKYYGIGVGLVQDPDTNEVTVSKVYEGTPGEAAGLRKDDVIVKVDGIDASSMELTVLVQKIRGDEGTTVELTIYRPSTKESLTMDVERQNVTLPSVKGELLDGDIAYIQISEFQSGTEEQFREKLDELKEQGAKALIVDVRGNPGGLLTAVVNILDDLLPKGTVVYTIVSILIGLLCGGSGLALIANGLPGIFAGAIKDYEYGTLIGTKTFGKGIVQTIYPLSDGDAVKITTAKYYTPDGNYIHGVGIEPDIELSYEYTGPDELSYEYAYDNQLQKAIEILQAS